MWFKRMLFLTILSSAFILTQIGLAEEEEARKSGRYNLGQVVVTATKTKRTVKNVSSTVTVITKEDIEKSNAKGVAELLMQVPGVYAYDQYGAGVEGHIGIRGFAPYGSERVLIMVDGVPWNSGNDGYVQQSKLPNIEGIERIEVVKGPSSALYGPFAMGGVINIITKKAPKKHTITNQWVFRSFGDWSQTTEIGGSSDFLNYRFSESYRAGDGYRENNAFIRRYASGRVEVMPDETLRLGFDFDLQGTNVEYAGNMTEEQFHDNPKQALSVSSGKLESYRLNWTCDKDINEFNHIKGQIYNTRYIYDYIGKYHYKGNIKSYGHEFQYHLDCPVFAMDNSFIIGTALKWDKIGYQYLYKNNLRTDDLTKVMLFGLYVQDEFKPVKPLTVTLGCRFDKVRYEYKPFYDYNKRPIFL